jgi:(1->4)-alpha-D-glucan 1-alpha-D-glucosylmutase
MSQNELSAYTDRIRRYMLKAVREAKVHSSWISPNTSHEDAVLGFVEAILGARRGNRFMTEFRELNAIVAACGMYNSLSQTVLRVFSPGVPDVYQGDELWAFNLADPDNRRLVDFEVRRKMLARLKKDSAGSRSPTALARALLDDANKDRLKLYVTWQSLEFRRENATLLNSGTYSPMEASGARKSHVCSFSRKKGRREVIVVVPRLMARLVRHGQTAPLGKEVWQESDLLLPNRARRGTYRNLFTGEVLTVASVGRPSLPLAQVFGIFPVAVLESINN